MKKFLVIGLIFLIGLAFCTNGYAQETTKKLRNFYPYASYTIGDEKDDLNGSYGLGLLGFLTSDFQCFVESALYFNKGDITGAIVNTINWMPLRKYSFSKCERYLIGLYSGFGMSYLWVDGQKKSFVVPAGIKGFYKSWYFDLKVNFFFNETSPHITGYPSLNFGIIF